MHPHVPFLRVATCALILGLSLAQAQGVRLHRSQVKPVQDILNAAKLRRVDASKIDCTRYKSPESTVSIYCTKGFPTDIYLFVPTMSTLPDSISALKELTNLDIQGGTIGGTLPATLGKLPKLMKLNILYGARMTSPIPKALGNLAALEYLFISNVGLVGSIPSELGKLASLSHMTLVGNKLQGAIPPSLGNLVSLTKLDLGNNELIGPIPASVQNLKKLEILSLANNNLTGSIPQFLQTPSALSLQELYLGGNYFVGVANGLCSIADYAYNCLSVKRSKCKIGPQRPAAECKSK